jgi:hypothetical protein
MKTGVYIFFILLLIQTGCKRDDENKTKCDVNNPLEELQWLTDIKNSLTNCSCDVSILQGTYKEVTVFYIMVTDPVCNSVFHVVLWDCNGDFVKEYKPGEDDLFFAEVELVDNIYTCSE